MYTVWKLTVVTALMVCLAGCSSLWVTDERKGVSSSLVDYLYPRGEVPPEYDEKIPQLVLPLRVGLAFVPSSAPSVSGLSEATKANLLERVRMEFQEPEYIQHIEIIPDTYMQSSKGFDGMQQVARLYGVDVMALVSYDQIAAIGDKKSSVLYWTIVGAYFIRGTENEVQTFVDTAVFDVSSRKLLFRAPGTNRIETSSTLAEASETFRETQQAGFQAAMADMTGNLVQELEKFEVRLKDEPTLAQVTWTDGSRGGGGSITWLALALLVIQQISRKGSEQK